MKAKHAGTSRIADQALIDQVRAAADDMTNWLEAHQLPPETTIAVDRERIWLMRWTGRALALLEQIGELQVTALITMQERAEAAEAFVDQWAVLLVSLPDDYSCHLTCSEADSAADLLRAFGMMQMAEALIGAHAEHDEEGDAHYPAEQIGEMGQ